MAELLMCCDDPTPNLDHNKTHLYCMNCDQSINARRIYALKVCVHKIDVAEDGKSQCNDCALMFCAYIETVGGRYEPSTPEPCENPATKTFVRDGKKYYCCDRHNPKNLDLE